MINAYYQSYQDYFWSWEDTSEVVVTIPGESTIAYRQFLFQIIDRIAPQGLPPFGSLLLALIATNQNGAQSIDFVKQILTKKITASDDAKMLEEAIVFLKMLCTLPAEYKVEARRMMVMQSLFADCHNIASLKDSREIAAGASTGLFNFEKMMTPQGFLMGVFRYEFRTIALLKRRFETIDSVIQAIAALPNTEPLEVEADKTRSGEEKPKAWIDELVEHDKTFAVGSLIRWLWGGLNIPVHSTLPSQQPLGGISDLTNKGDFDKLLVSEFAYDDISLMSRLANNEALYIHREVPPTSFDLNRIILIDASLKNWGTPKTIAFAVMLAIVRHPKTDINCQAYVLGKEKYYPIPNFTIHGIITALQIVESCLHASESLTLFLNDNPDSRKQEVFLITEPATLKHPEFLRTLNENRQGIHYIIHTDAEGNVDLYKRHLNTRKHMQHILLPLEKLWHSKKKKKINQLSESPTFSSIPILLRDPVLKKRIAIAPDGEIFQVTPDRSILKLFDLSSSKTKGWEVVWRELSFTPHHFEVGQSATGEYIALLYNSGGAGIQLINLITGISKSLNFPHWKYTEWPAFIFMSGKFYHLNKIGSWRIDLDGNILASDFLQQGPFRDKTDQLDKARTRHQTNDTVLKNIHKVSISSLGSLELGDHKLVLQGNYLKFMPERDHSRSIQGRREKPDEFLFADGSMVKTNRNGYVELKSSSVNIPTIYMPTCLHGTIGVATESEFAGNDYFYKGSHTISLQGFGTQALAVMKILVEEFGMRLSNAKEFLNKLPATLPGKYSIRKAEELSNKIKQVGGEAQLNGVMATQKVISVPEFYSLYIQAFINTIIRNGV